MVLFTLLIITKLRLVKALVWPVMMYGCKAWTLKKKRRVQTFENKLHPKTAENFMDRAADNWTSLWKSAQMRSKHRAGCSKAEPKIFAPPQTPFPGVQDGQNLISWWSLPLPTNPVWWGSMHAISSYRGNRPTNTQNHKQTDRMWCMDVKHGHCNYITIHCAAVSAQCNKMAGTER